MNLKALTKTARRTLSRNSSKILLGLGNIAYKINTHNIEYSIISSVTVSVGRG